MWQEIQPRRPENQKNRRGPFPVVIRSPAADCWPMQPAPSRTAQSTSYIHRQLAREVLNNEILRAHLLLGVFGILGSFLALAPVLFPDVYQQVTRGRVPTVSAPLFFGTICLFFLLLGVIWF